jgi:predicted transcriptional regulator of viral defense system
MRKNRPELQKEVVRLSSARRQRRDSAVLRMARSGNLQKLRPGVYRSTKRETWAHQDLADACLAVPEGVICLISALSYHGLTTTIPGETWIAIPKTSWVPTMAFPTRFIRLGESAYAAGIEIIKIGRTKVRIYSKAKTVCDALRFRDKVGVDVAFEALKTFLRQGGRPDELIQWEEVCRIKTTLRGHLSILLA